MARSIRESYGARNPTSPAPRRSGQWKRATRGAARLLVEIGGIDRFPSKAHFASWNGTPPIDASSGDLVRHRLSRAGNRQINRVIHVMAIVQLRNHTIGRAYVDRRVGEGKTSMEAVRALKRHLSDAIYHHMILDAQPARTGPGGQPGNDSDSSAADSHPAIDSSDQPLPGPAGTQPKTHLLAAS